MAWLTHGCFTLVTLLVIVSLSVASLHDTSHSFELVAIQGQVLQGYTTVMHPTCAQRLPRQLECNVTESDRFIR